MTDELLTDGQKLHSIQAMGKATPLSIKKHDSNPLKPWVVTGPAWLNPDPKRKGKRWRLHFTTEGQARVKRDELKVLMENSGRGAEVISDALRAEALEASRILAPYPGRKLTEAAVFFANYLEISAKSIPFVEAVTLVVNAKKADKDLSERYRSDFEGRLNNFLSVFGVRPIGLITPSQIEEALFELNLGKQSWNNYRTVLFTLWNHPPIRRICPINPVKDVERKDVKSYAKGVLTIGQVTNMLRFAFLGIPRQRGRHDTQTPYFSVVEPFELIAPVAIGLFGLVRREEIELMQVKSIRWDHQDVLVDEQIAKKGYSRYVGMKPVLEAWLKLAKNYFDRDDELSKEKRLLQSIVPVNYRRKMETLRMAAGITDWPDNAIRHTGASHHLACFQDLPALLDTLGHRDSDLIFKHYRKMKTPEEGKEYYGLLPQVVLPDLHDIL